VKAGRGWLIEWVLEPDLGDQARGEVRVVDDSLKVYSHMVKVLAL